MSITIKHLDGPLNGEKSFGDDTGTILIGRGPGAQIDYEGCLAVEPEHLKLNREGDGSYTIELGDSDKVEIDGKPAETGMAVTSGSVITVGEGGPKFEVLMPGLTIKHLEGPLAGQCQFFSDSVKTITFGRPPDKTNVAYPEDFTKVGRFHLSLKQTDLGNDVVGLTYVVELTPGHYVEINKEPAKSQSPVKSGSKFRLGDPKGPTFEVLIEQPAKQGKITTIIYEPPSEFRLIKQLQRVAAVLLVMVLAGGAFFFYRDLQHKEEVSQLTADLAKVDDELAKRAADEIDQTEQQTVLAAVYLVARLENGEPVGKATAWAFAPDMLATNAHVTSQIEGNESDYVLIGPKGEQITIKNVKSHPGYAGFKDYLPTVGGTKGGKFEQLDVINEYDVGIIYPGKPLPADGRHEPTTLRLASQDEVEALRPGAAVAAVGFPIEGMTANMVAEHAPATLHFGNISSLTDVFMCRADDEKDRLLIQHTVPVTGGMSGSPLVDGSGKVIGVVSGGNTATFITQVTLPKGASSQASNGNSPGKNKLEIENMRVPSAAMVNFAQRVDLLEALKHDAVDLAAERRYWDAAAAKFVSVFDTAKADLLASAGIDQPGSEQVRKGTLKPREAGVPWFDSQGHDFVFEPGHVYGIIVKIKSGLPIAMNVKKQSASKDEPPVFLKGKSDTLKTPVSPLAPATWVTVDATTPVEISVLAMVKQPADYELYVYDWAKPG